VGIRFSYYHVNRDHLPPNNCSLPSPSHAASSFLARILNLLLSGSFTRTHFIPMAAAQPASFPHSLCTTQQSVDAAVNFLQSCEEIIVDWTGCDVGVQGGTLSTIVICKVRRERARSIPTVYIFDILELGNAGCSLQPIFTLLRSPDVRKFVFDGRYGNSALRLYAGDTDSSVSIFNNVIDIQLAETNYRVRSPKDRRCLHFLKPAQRLGMTVNYVRKNAEIFRHVHVLSSFGKCISYCRLGEDNHNGMIHFCDIIGMKVTLYVQHWILLSGLFVPCPKNRFQTL